MKSADKRNPEISRPVVYADFHNHDITTAVDRKFPIPEGKLTNNTITSIVRVAVDDETENPTCANLALYDDNILVQSVFCQVDGVFPDVAIVDVGFPATSSVSQKAIIDRLKKSHAALITECEKDAPDFTVARLS